MNNTITRNSSLFIALFTILIFTLGANEAFGQVSCSTADGTQDSCVIKDQGFDISSDVHVDSTRIYVVDTFNHRIQIFDNNGNFIKSFGDFGRESGNFSHPRAISSNANNIFVADTRNDRIQIFDKDGNFIKSFGSRGSTDGQFYRVRDIHADSTRLYVADLHNHRIQIFDHDGNFIKAFGSEGTGNGKFDLPTGITTNSTHIFVVDHRNHRIQIFDKDGNHVQSFGSRIDSVSVFTNASDIRFDHPISITSTTDRLYVSNAGNDSVIVFDHDGKFITTFGTRGSGDGEFITPQGLFANSTHILVADSLNQRIQIFNNSDSFAGFTMNGLPRTEFQQSQQAQFYSERIVFTSSDSDASINSEHIVFTSSDSDASINSEHIVITPDTFNNQDDTKSSSDSSEWKKSPTFGKSADGIQLVKDGFIFNGHKLTITDNWHTEFPKTDSIIGDVNTISLKVYSVSPLYQISLALGVSEIGNTHDAETEILLTLEENYDIPNLYDIAEINHIQTESLIDPSKTDIEITQVPCGVTDDTCTGIDIHFAINAPLVSNVLSITAIDDKSRSTVTYINEGVEFTGESLLLAKQHTIHNKVSNQDALDIIILTQDDRRYPVYTDQYGNQWTHNDYNTWSKITLDDIPVSQDDTWTVMNRMHSGFDSHIQKEQDKAREIFDSNDIQNDIKDSFAFDIPDRLSDTKLLDVETRRALEKLQ